MERKFIPQIDRDSTPKTAGWFFQENMKGLREVFFYVPLLDGYARLYPYAIDANGGVSPSVRVNGKDKEGKPVTYEEFVILSGWPVGVSKPEGTQFV